jgi:hypothetical protein
MNSSSSSCLDIIKRQFDPCLEMLWKIIDYCPEDVWLREEAGAPFWQQVYHTIYWMDFWLREEYSQAEYRSMIIEKGLSFELDKVSRDCLSREESQEYLEKVQAKLERFFGKLDDGKLTSPIVERSGFTYLDAIVSQIRHIQYHVGQCNTILGGQGEKTVEWIAYNENRT